MMNRSGAGNELASTESIKDGLVAVASGRGRLAASLLRKGSSADPNRPPLHVAPFERPLHEPPRNVLRRPRGAGGESTPPHEAPCREVRNDNTKPTKPRRHVIDRTGRDRGARLEQRPEELATVEHLLDEERAVELPVARPLRHCAHELLAAHLRARVCGWGVEGALSRAPQRRAAVQGGWGRAAGAPSAQQRPSRASRRRGSHSSAGGPPSRCTRARLPSRAPRRTPRSALCVGSRGGGAVAAASPLSARRAPGK